MRNPTKQMMPQIALAILTIGLLPCLEIAYSGAPLALAKSSGARSRGGSFKSAPAPSQPRSSSPDRQPSQPRYDDYRPQPSWDYPRSVPIPIPIPNSYPNSYPSQTYPNQTFPDQRNNTQPNQPQTQQTNPPLNGTTPNATSTQGSTVQSTDYSWLILPGAAVAGGAGYWYWSSQRKKKGANPGSAEEISNEIVSVSEIQIAMLANSPIQQQLTEIVETMAIDTPAQLKEQFQTVVVSLLRLPEYWSHAKVSSQTFPSRTAAEGYFEQWSIKERSKLTQETLTRDSLGLRQRELLQSDIAEDPAAYVVVTLLIGTTHDQPLVEKVYSAESLKEVLEKLSAISEQELLVFELIWTPQDAADSLSRDELLTEFGDLVMV